MYKEHDRVNLACDGCLGKPSCCIDMGTSVVLNPYDMYQLSQSQEKSFHQLQGDLLSIAFVDGFVVPCMKMDELSKRCIALNEKGRCKIHADRPGICRLFPLGRKYEEKSIRYFMLENVCPCKAQESRKIKQWLEIANYPQQEQFLLTWHKFKKEVAHILANKEEAYIGQAQTYIMQFFFVKPYHKGTFFEEFYQRIEEAREVFREDGR